MQWGKIVCCGAILYVVGVVCSVRLGLYIIGYVVVLCTRSIHWSFLYVVGQVLVL